MSRTTTLAGGGKWNRETWHHAAWQRGTRYQVDEVHIMFRAAKNCPALFDLVRVVRSRDVHPCYLVSRCPVSRFQRPRRRCCMQTYRSPKTAAQNLCTRCPHCREQDTKAYIYIYMYRFYYLYLSSILCCNSPNKHIIIIIIKKYEQAAACALCT